MTPTIHVFTTCLNVGPALDASLDSVIAQTGELKLRLHVQDRGSSDDTAERLARWSATFDNKTVRLESGPSLRFSTGVSPGATPAQALLDAVRTLGRVPGAAFMTWLAPGDRLQPGALAFVADVAARFGEQDCAWLSGAGAVMRDGRIVASADQPTPTEVVRAGLCDGVHWPVLPGTGVFFRKWLWTKANPASAFERGQAAAEWNLWRLFAEFSPLVQTRRTLAAFPAGAALCPEAARAWRQAGERILPSEARRLALAHLSDGVLPTRTELVETPSGTLTLRQSPADALFARYRARILGARTPDAGDPIPSAPPALGATALDHAILRVAQSGPPREADALLLLRCCAAAMLRDSGFRVEARQGLPAALAAARDALPDGHDTLRHFDRVAALRAA